MPTKVTLTLDGFDQYLEDLVKAGEDIDQVADEALAAGADVLVEGMRRRASWSRRIPPFINRSRVMRDGNKHFVYIGVLHGSPLPIARMAATYEFGGRKVAREYKRKNEDGTTRERSDVRRYDTRYGKKGTKIEWKTAGRRVSRPWIKARPWMRRTLRSDAESAKAAMEEVFQEWLNK